MYLQQFWISLRALAVMTVLTGVIYPALITGVAQTLFRDQANGSLILKDGKPVGSKLIGRSFDQPEYFWGRLSATGPTPYNGAASSGSNLGPLNPALLKTVQDRIAALSAADPGNNQPIPVDLVTSSGSGLDPHITPAAARYQLARVARMRGISEAVIENLIQQHTHGRFWGVLGEPSVNVLLLNLSLDDLDDAARPGSAS